MGNQKLSSLMAPCGRSYKLGTLRTTCFFKNSPQLTTPYLPPLSLESAFDTPIIPFEEKGELIELWLKHWAKSCEVSFKARTDRTIRGNGQARTIKANNVAIPEHGKVQTQVRRPTQESGIPAQSDQYHHGQVDSTEWSLAKLPHKEAAWQWKQAGCLPNLCLQETHRVQWHGLRARLHYGPNFSTGAQYAAIKIQAAARRVSRLPRQNKSHAQKSDRNSKQRAKLCWAS
jgi:hypothetical protein